MGRVGARLSKLKVDYEVFPAVHVDSVPYQMHAGRISPGAYACALSHAALIEQIRKRGYENALIMEDDVIFRDDTSQIMCEISKECTDQEWDILYLGLHLRKSDGRLSRHLGRVKNGFHSHAYAVSKRGLPRIEASIDNTLKNPLQTFDGFRDSNLLKLYTIPLLAVQEPNYSYTYTKYTDRLPQYFSVFDGEEFEANCFELQEIESDWRQVLSFKQCLAEAERAYWGGSLHDAAHKCRALITACPRFSAHLLCEAPSSVLRIRDSRNNPDVDIIEAFRWLAETSVRLLSGSL